MSYRAKLMSYRAAATISEIADAHTIVSGSHMSND